MLRGLKNCIVLLGAVAVGFIVFVGCGSGSRDALPAVPALPRSITYAAVTFQVPASWRHCRGSGQRSELSRGEVGIADSNDPEHPYIVAGRRYRFFPIFSRTDKCFDMRVLRRHLAYHQGQTGVTTEISTTISTLKMLGALGVYEYDAIPSRNIGLQLFGFGPTIIKALATDRAVIATARAAT